MALIKLQRSVHGRSAMATYAFNLYKLTIYLRHTRPGRRDYGDFYLSCYLLPNSATTDTDPEMKEFFTYGEFREYRAKLYATHGTDSRLKSK